jgi:hypothetical protein
LRKLSRITAGGCEGRFTERRSAIAEIEAGWAKQARRPTPEEIDTWISSGRTEGNEAALDTCAADPYD